jgi:hypothetical protein
MSESQPKARLPFSSAVFSTAAESVFCIRTSAPPLISAVAASVSLGGSNHWLTQTTLVLIQRLNPLARRATRQNRAQRRLRTMNTIEKILLFGAAPAVLLLSLLEAVVLSRRRPGREPYDWRAYGVSLFDFAGRIAVTLFLPLSIASPLIGWVESTA